MIANIKKYVPKKYPELEKENTTQVSKEKKLKKSRKSKKVEKS